MKTRNLHDWNVTPTQAVEIQHRLAAQVSENSNPGAPNLVAGVDVSGVKASGNARAVVIVLSYPELEVMETGAAEGRPVFPYIPGLLSFREAPLILAACERLELTPDMFLVDGQGIAHPRRFGLACHLGLILDKPSIGCAKSLLCGAYEEPGAKPGSYSEIVDRGEIVGAALRTKRGTKPVYVSIGHKIDLPTAIYWVMQCCRGYRLPEPTRLAHQAAGATWN